MAIILPFKGIRPTPDKVNLVASRPVDSYSKEDLKEKLKGNPFTFLHVINPDHSDGKRTKPGSEERLRKIKTKFLSYIKEGILTEENKEAYYLYRQIKEGQVFTGLIARASIDDYLNGVIRVHEATLTEREMKLKEYLEICDFNAEPVLLFYPEDKEINRTINRYLKVRPDYDFTTTDKVRHSLWSISDRPSVSILRKRFAGMEKVYIADGHHRSSSSALLGLSKRERSRRFTGKEAWNFYMGIFLSESQLRIYDFNRVVKDLKDFGKEDFIKALQNDFEVKEQASAFAPKKKHVFGMYLDGIWYSLALKKEKWSKGPVESLDAEILTRRILHPLLGIVDLRADKRIGFVAGVKGMKGLTQKVDSGEFRVAFSLCPVTLDAIKNVADTNNIMPPKTTWVEPKMRSGLVIYSLSEKKK